MFKETVMDAVKQFKNKKETQDAAAKNTEFTPDYYKTTDSELSTFSDAADYRLTDGMEDYMLSDSMNQAASSVPEIPVGMDTMPDMSMVPSEMPMAMAKGGLVARRKK